MSQGGLDFMNIPSWSLKESAELAGQAMLAWLDPQSGYMPIFCLSSVAASSAFI